MSNLRLTSPGILLILAVVAAGGIFMLDYLYLAPQMAELQLDALREQGVQADLMVQRELLTQQQRLRRGLQVAVDEGRQGTTIESLQGLSVAAGATHVWTTDADGRIQQFVPALPDGSEILSRNDLAAATTALLAAEANQTQGLIGVGPTAMVFVRSDDYLWLGASVESILPESVVLIRDRSIPDGVLDPTNELHSLWWAKPDETLTVSWASFDAVGDALGYFQTKLPVWQVHRQAVAARRLVLIVLVLAVGVAALVLLGMHILIAGPVYRLLGRLKDIQYGDSAPRDLTQDLHGEPLVLARRLESAFDKLAEMSRTDDLTGLANRRHFEQVLEAFYTQARRYNRPLSLMVLDIDFFKAVNDTAGHAAGDELLKTISKAITDSCRQADLPARLGGDEFVILLPETASHEAEVLARRICDNIDAQGIEINGADMQITVSAGLTDLNVGGVDSPSSLLAAADRALYEAKDRGRACLVSAHETEGMDWACHEGNQRASRLQSTLAGLDSDFKGLFVKAMSEIVDVFETRSPHMADHARKTQAYSVALAREMGLPDRIVSRIQVAAMFHDIGLFLLPDALLQESELDADQIKTLRSHPLISVRIMERMEFLDQEIPAVRYHHENFDGTGYPEGLSGGAIPLSARIISVANVYDEMVFARPFRQEFGWEQALEELQKQAGTIFDPAIVETFAALVRRHGESFTEFAEAGIEAFSPAV